MLFSHLSSSFLILFLFSSSSCSSTASYPTPRCALRPELLTSSSRRLLRPELLPLPSRHLFSTYPCHPRARASSPAPWCALRPELLPPLSRHLLLTTDGLPTFIDIGNSFGAPAIVEDNLIHQPISNGKKILLMGDDTWIQLFPHHFHACHPYPSFNVKDLDSVDDGCIEHLFPSLLRDDWYVLMAHLLGVDHAGNIFGVDSTPMTQKLEQYNAVLVIVVEVMFNHSSPDDVHENTFLVVMGDHGQTVDGDHGRGAPEEVETALFTLRLKSPPDIALSILESDSYGLNCEGESICAGSIQQIDFAATIAVLLGVPIPFGSIVWIHASFFLDMSLLILP